MLTQIDVLHGNDLGDQALALPIASITPKDSLLLRQVQGLNPPDIDLFIGDYSRDGGIYQGRRVGNRNVVLLIDLNPNPALGETVSGLRDMLYKIFVDPVVDADYVHLILHDDVREPRFVYGYTEKFETEPFSAETMVQVSMICPDPYIKDNVETVLEHPTGWSLVPFQYNGTAETGFKAEVYINQVTSTLTLVNNGRSMTINHPFSAGDRVMINTKRGEHDVYMMDANGIYLSPLAAKLTNTSRWLELHSQANTMTIYGSSPGDGQAVVRKLQYTATYWGI